MAAKKRVLLIRLVVAVIQQYWLLAQQDPVPQFQDQFGIPATTSLTTFQPQISFNFEDSSAWPGATDSIWQQFDVATLTPHGYQLTSLTAENSHGSIASVEAINSTMDWRIELKINTNFRDGHSGWFVFLLSPRPLIYSLSSTEPQEIEFRNLQGVAIFTQLQRQPQVFATYNNGLERSPTVAIPGNFSAMSEPNCGGDILTLTNSLEYDMIVQSVEDSVSVVIIFQNNVNESCVCFRDVKMPGLGSMGSSGQLQIRMSGLQGDVADVGITRLHVFGLDVAPKADENTGFPIPSLIDGNMYPHVTMDDLTQCPSLSPYVKSPDYDTKVYASFQVERLVGVDAMTGTVDVFASLYLQWEVLSCSAAETAPGVDQSERLFSHNVTSLWRPRLLFTNSSNDVYMERQKFGEHLTVVYAPTRPNRTLFFHWVRLGIFSSRCRLYLEFFPYDTQECDFTFQIEEPARFVHFGGVHLEGQSLHSSDKWIFEGSGTQFGITPSVTRRNGTSSFAKVRLKFARDPTHYLVNLMAPCYVLVSLVFGSFLLRPDLPDRAMFCCMLLLALTVAQSDVLDAVPQTSQRIRFAENILSLTGLTGSITFYDMAICTLAGMRDVVKPRTARIIDVFALLVAFIGLIVIDVRSGIILSKYYADW